MEIFILVLLYYLSQNERFAESVKPLMGKIKDSEEMLRFLNDLSNFTQNFGVGQKQPPTPKPPEPPKHAETPPCKEEGEKNPQSPTAGIADEFIQNILDGYFTQSKNRR